MVEPALAQQQQVLLALTGTFEATAHDVPTKMLRVYQTEPSVGCGITA
jgi:hypothetical protein